LAPTSKAIFLFDIANKKLHTKINNSSNNWEIFASAMQYANVSVMGEIFYDMKG